MSSKSRRDVEPELLRPGRLRAIRLFALAAMAISAYLAWLSLTGGAAVGCGPESGCDKVLHSRWAYWFGLPVSLFAVATYSLMLGASFRLTGNAPPPVQRKAWTWLIACALVVVGAVVWFVALQILDVKAFCFYCLVAHGCGLTASVLLLVGAPMRRAPAKPWDSEKQVYLTPRVVRKVALVVAVALAALITGQALQKHRTFVVTSIPNVTNAPAPALAVAHTASITNPPPSPPRTVPPPKIETGSAPSASRRMFAIYGGRFEIDLRQVPVIGALTNEQVAVSLFDYTCHHCRSMHAILLEAQRTFRNSLVVASLPMPLDPDCNRTMQRPHPMHTNACAYARLGLAVWHADRAKHHEFDEWLLTGETPPPLADARQRAAELVGAASLDNALRDRWVEEQLKLDVNIYALAYENRQGSMPQLIVGNKVAVGTYLLTDLLKLLAENLPLPAAP
jgi:uncharacterized membrane protein